MSQARLREALTAGGANSKEKGPPVADGVLTETPDTTEAIEWRNKSSLIDTVASTSTYMSDDDDGIHPGQLYGKFTWKMEKFNQTSKRELRSNTFNVGGLKWYILVYPQGCDVANHLSLFLCVADYDKLLPGWSHFAQFTIAVVNKDPKKSKYSDTLHRFCKKEHDWGWKKFMELNKIADGFVVNDEFIIKAQVQVIKDKPYRPFRTLDNQYRRELLRVYLANVEGIIRRFIDEKREILSGLLAPARGFKEFWDSLPASDKVALSSEQAPTIFKGLAKRFFNDKEVTSTIIMDALYCGAKILEARAANPKLVVAGIQISENSVLINSAKNSFYFAGDTLETLTRVAEEALPVYSTADKSSDSTSLRTAVDADGVYSMEAVQKDEERLVDMGRRTVEVFAVAHIASVLMETALVEAETMRRQEELIKEVEELSREEQERNLAKAEAEKEKRARKKERQKRKKDAEKAKKEAEEAEKQRIEAEKREQQERKHREAEERRRREEEAREAERQKALAAKKQADARRQQEAAAKAAAKAAEKSSNKGQPMSDVNSVASLGVSEGKISQNGSEHAESTGQPPSRSSSIKSTSDTTAELGNNAASANSRPDSARSVPPSSGTRSNGQKVPSTAEVIDQTEPMSPNFEAIIEEKDAEIAALRSKISELEAQLAAAVLGRPASAPAAASAVSQGSLDFGLARAQSNIASASSTGNSVASSRSSSRTGLATTAAQTGPPPGMPSLQTPSSAILASASMSVPMPTSTAGFVSGSASASARNLTRINNGNGKILTLQEQQEQAVRPYGHSRVAENVHHLSGYRGTAMGAPQPNRPAPRTFSAPLPTATAPQAAGPNAGKCTDAPVVESSGLDDFAHMGLITDLLE